MSEPKTHFIGVGGIGMSALARLLLLKKQAVSGSDQKGSPLIESLKVLGLKGSVGHDPSHLPESGRIVISTGIKADNIELKGCLKERHEVVHRSQLLKELMEEASPLLVAGSHGKTTTSSLLATVFTEAGKYPSWAVGGIVNAYGTNAQLGSGDYFIAEADESDGTHASYHPYGLILTNIDEEHMDFYQSKDRLMASFKTLLNQTTSKAHLFYCADDPGIQEIKPEGISYGFSDVANLKVVNFEQQEGGICFDLEYQGNTYKSVKLPLLGRHNALNGAAVFGLSLSLGLLENQIRQGFLSFKGAKRRLDVKLDKREALVIEDYAHHPSEIKPTLEALRASYPDRTLTVFFQPHKYSRTKACLSHFKNAFLAADKVYITDIYTAGESPIEGITPQAIVKTLKKGEYIGKSVLKEKIIKSIKPFEVVVIMGAGDIGQIAEAVSDIDPRKLKVACVFGGVSKEHEVSIVSAKGVTTYLNPDIFEVIPFGISKEGHWVTGKGAIDFLSGHPFPELKANSTKEALGDLTECDIVFPVLHGPNGEDGTIQGLFEILGLPYVGCSVESSAICMNKATSKKLAEHAGIPVAPYVSFTEEEWSLDKEAILQAISMKLTYPIFVKAVHLGSSIGIFKVLNPNNLKEVIAETFLYDKEIIVETGVKGRELECAVIGKGPWLTTDPGEILAGGEVYDYEKKYGASSFKSDIKANLTEVEKKEVRELALKVYKALGCDGMARVDLFYTDKGLLFSEINPIPGFTPISLFPKMYEGMGIDYKMLLTKLCRQALDKNRKANRLLSKLALL